jgi:Protein of unknown function (DUF3396)
MSDPIRSDIMVLGPGAAPLVREAVRIVLYLNQSRAATRDAARSAIERFVSMIGLNALDSFFDNEGDSQKLTAEAFSRLMHDWFSAQGAFGSLPNATIDLRGPGEFSFESGVQYWGKALGPTDRPDNTAFLHLWMPRAALSRKSGELRQFLSQTAAELPVCSGYVSPALVGPDGAAKQGLGQRYAGIDIANPEAISSDLGGSHAGCYWLNWLGPALTERAGGAQAMSDALGEDIVVSPMGDGGAVVRLGPAPQLGDRNRRESLPAYETFARFLHGEGLLHVPKRVSYFKTMDGLADRDGQRAWHQRFLP